MDRLPTLGQLRWPQTSQPLLQSRSERRFSSNCRVNAIQPETTARGLIKLHILSGNPTAAEINRTLRLDARAAGWLDRRIIAGITVQ